MEYNSSTRAGSAGVRLKHYKPVETLKVGDVVSWMGAPYEVANVYPGQESEFATLSLIPLNKFITVTLHNDVRLEILSC